MLINYLFIDTMCVALNHLIEDVKYHNIENLKILLNYKCYLDNK